MSAKPKIGYMLPVAKAIRDEYTKQWTYVDVFSVVFIPKSLESYIQSFYIVGRVNDVKKGAGTLRVDIVQPDGSTLDKVILSSDHIKQGDLDFSAYFQFVKFSQVGRHYVRLQYNDTPLEDYDSVYFDVRREA